MAVFVQKLPAPAQRRGACPSLTAPMKTGDGLLVRLRPQTAGLHPAQLRRIALAAAQYGNGILEVTARGNLQVRGLTANHIGAFSETIDQAGIATQTGIAIEIPPLCGLDPAEHADAATVQANIRQRLQSSALPSGLAAKFSIVVDGGGRFHLDAVIADIRLKAEPYSKDKVVWRMSLGGDSAKARSIGLFAGDRVAEAVTGILEHLASKGPATRGRDIDTAIARAITARWALEALSAHCVAQSLAPAPPLTGIHDLGGSASVVGIGLAFCQTTAGDLIALLDHAQNAGAYEVRPAPGHGLFFIGLSQSDGDDLLLCAALLGFRTKADDPRNRISLCAGANGCASGFFDTRLLAKRLIEAAPSLFDGSAKLHLSGCAKGCAHPAPATLLLAGAPQAYAFGLNASASAPSDLYIPAENVDAAVEKLDALLRDSKRAGETAASCLERLGSGRIAAAMQQATMQRK